VISDAMLDDISFWATGVGVIGTAIWYLFWRVRDLERLCGSDILGSVRDWHLRIGHDAAGSRIITIEIQTHEARNDYGAKYDYVSFTKAEAQQLAGWLREAAGEKEKGPHEAAL
jgi:hypothetical protein